MKRISYSDIEALPLGTLIYNDDETEESVTEDRPRYIILKTSNCNRDRFVYQELEEYGEGMDTISYRALESEHFWLPDNDKELMAIQDTFAEQTDSRHDALDEDVIEILTEWEYL